MFRDYWLLAVFLHGERKRCASHILIRIVYVLRLRAALQAILVLGIELLEERSVFQHLFFQLDRDRGSEVIGLLEV